MHLSFLLVFIGHSILVQSEALHSLFYAFQAKYDKQYATPQESQYRYQVFSENYNLILTHNSNPSKDYEMGMNKFGDLTVDEFSQTLSRAYDTTVVTRSGKVPVSNFTVYSSYGSGDGGYWDDTDDGDSNQSSFVQNVPENVDWVKEGKVSQVRDQFNCGGCWAFAVNDAIESRFAIKHGIDAIELSIQEQLDCNYNGINDGCIGGNLPEGYDYVIDNKGLCLESQYPYLGDSQAHKADCVEKRKQCTKRFAKVKDYGFVVRNSEGALKDAVAQGPVAIAIEADARKMQFYKRGILMTTECGTNVDHAVTMVGYGIDKLGRKYWKIKNSWGQDWGEDGYMRLCRECGRNGNTGMCGITVEAVFPIF